MPILSSSAKSRKAGRHGTDIKSGLFLVPTLPRGNAYGANNTQRGGNLLKQSIDVTPVRGIILVGMV